MANVREIILAAEHTEKLITNNPENFAPITNCISQFIKSKKNSNDIFCNSSIETLQNIYLNQNYISYHPNLLKFMNDMFKDNGYKDEETKILIINYNQICYGLILNFGIHAHIYKLAQNIQDNFIISYQPKSKSKKSNFNQQTEQKLNEILKNSKNELKEFSIILFNTWKNNLENNRKIEINDFYCCYTEDEIKEDNEKLKKEKNEFLNNEFSI